MSKTNLIKVEFDKNSIDEPVSASVRTKINTMDDVLELIPTFCVAFQNKLRVNFNQQNVRRIHLVAALLFATTFEEDVIPHEDVLMLSDAYLYARALMKYKREELNAMFAPLMKGLTDQMNGKKDNEPAKMPDFSGEAMHGRFIETLKQMGREFNEGIINCITSEE